MTKAVMNVGRGGAHESVGRLGRVLGNGVVGLSRHFVDWVGMESPAWCDRLGRARWVYLSIKLWSGIVANLDAGCVLCQLVEGDFQIEQYSVEHKISDNHQPTKKEMDILLSWLRVPLELCGCGTRLERWSWNRGSWMQTFCYLKLTVFGVCSFFFFFFCGQELVCCETDRR